MNLVNTNPILIIQRGRRFSTAGELPFSNCPVPRRAYEHRVIGVPTTVPHRCFMILKRRNLGSGNLHRLIKITRSSDWNLLAERIKRTAHTKSYIYTQQLCDPVYMYFWPVLQILRRWNISLVSNNRQYSEMSKKLIPR